MSIFISYSRKDQDYVNKLVEALRKQELPWWLDNKIDYGDQWTKEIKENLKKCQVFLLVMSPSSEESDWVQRELIFAQQLKKPIFPLLLAGERWFEVGDIQMTDVQGGELPPDIFFNKVRSKLNNKTVQLTAEQTFISNNITLNSQISPNIQTSKLSIEGGEEGEGEGEGGEEGEGEGGGEGGEGEGEGLIFSWKVVTVLFLCFGVEGFYMANISAPLWLWQVFLTMGISGIVFIVSLLNLAVNSLPMSGLNSLLMVVSIYSYIFWFLTADIWEIWHLTDKFGTPNFASFTTIQSFTFVCILVFTFICILIKEFVLTVIAGSSVYILAFLARNFSNQIFIYLLLIAIALAGLASGLELVQLLKNTL
jgi:hypothetical protein